MEPRPNDLASPRRVICSRCGVAFDCRLGGECWCTAEPFRARMPKQGSTEDCLCATCLRATTERPV